MDGEAENPSNGGRVRPPAREDGLIPQPHGGALAPPLRPGHAPMGGFRKHRREAIRLLNEGLPEAAKRVLEMTRSPDERVAIVATKELMDRTLGKPSDMPHAEGANGSIDLRHLTAAERERLLVALAEIRELRGLAEARAGRDRGEGPTIEGSVEPSQ